MDAKLDAAAAKIEAELLNLTKRMDKARKTLEVARKSPLRIKISGLVKAYMDAVKASDGLTSVRPATLKAIQSAEAKASPKSVQFAIKALKDHIDAVTKASGNDKGAKKQLDKFVKAANNVIGGLKKFL